MTLRCHSISRCANENTAPQRWFNPISQQELPGCQWRLQERFGNRRLVTVYDCPIELPSHTFQLPRTNNLHSMWQRTVDNHLYVYLSVCLSVILSTHGGQEREEAFPLLMKALKSTLLCIKHKFSFKAEIKSIWTSFFGVFYFPNSSTSGKQSTMHRVGTEPWMQSSGNTSHSTHSLCFLLSFLLKRENYHIHADAPFSKVAAIRCAAHLPLGNGSSYTHLQVKIPSPSLWWLTPSLAQS